LRLGEYFAIASLQLNPQISEVLDPQRTGLHLASFNLQPPLLVECPLRFAFLLGVLLANADELRDASGLFVNMAEHLVTNVRGSSHITQHYLRFGQSISTADSGERTRDGQSRFLASNGHEFAIGVT
jgi:hypothetical protein